MKKVVIIGAGILGATTAYRLAKKGVKVIIIDQKDQGQATAAAAGIICPWLTQRRNKAWYYLAKEGARLYPSLIQELNEDGETNTGYSRVGALSLHNDRDKLMKAYNRGLKRIPDTPEMGELTILDAKQTKELFPLADDKYESFHISGAARVDGRSIRAALLSGAKKYGAELKLGKAEILNKKSNVTGVLLNGTVIEADSVICTSGAWMNETLKPLGIQFKSYPQRGQILHFNLQGVDTNQWPVIMPPNHLSIVPFSDRIVVGATHEDDAGFEAQLTAGGMKEILDKAMDIIPGLSDWSLLETRVGFRPFTPGSLPVFGSIPSFSHLYAANGLGASGLTTGPYLGTQLAKLVLDEELDIDLANYDINHALKG